MLPQLNILQLIYPYSCGKITPMGPGGFIMVSLEHLPLCPVPPLSPLVTSGLLFRYPMETFLSPFTYMATIVVSRLEWMMDGLISLSKQDTPHLIELYPLTALNSDDGGVVMIVSKVAYIPMQLA